MMEAASTSETLVNFYQKIWRCNPEDSHLQIIGFFRNIDEKLIFFDTSKNALIM
jgi:hypothetical protein